MYHVLLRILSYIRYTSTLASNGVILLSHRSINKTVPFSACIHVFLFQFMPFIAPSYDQSKAPPSYLSAAFCPSIYIGFLNTHTLPRADTQSHVCGWHVHVSRTCCPLIGLYLFPLSVFKTTWPTLTVYTHSLSIITVIQDKSL